MERKWAYYYVTIILVFLIGRWILIDMAGFESGRPDETYRLVYVAWVNGFAVLFLGPALVLSVRWVIRRVRETVPSLEWRLVTWFFSLVILLFLFVVVYYSFILSF